MKRVALALGVLGLTCACGGLPEEAEAPALGEAEVYSGAARFVVWQHNITAYFEDLNIARSLDEAFAHRVTPDILILQECPKDACLVGPGATVDAEGRVSHPDSGTVAGWLEAHGWLSQYRFANAMSRAIVWRNNSGGKEDTRFKLIKKFVWGSKNYPQGNATDPDTSDSFVPCATVLGGIWRIPTVALADMRAGLAAQRNILVSSTHWYVTQDCAVEMLTWFESQWKSAPELTNADGVPAGQYIHGALMGGDWNATPNTYLPMAYADGRIGGEPHQDLGANAGLTYNGLNGSTRETKRVDYLFARSFNGAGLTIGNVTVDRDTVYPLWPLNDHGALRAVVRY